MIGPAIVRIAGGTVELTGPGGTVRHRPEGDPRRAEIAARRLRRARDNGMDEQHVATALQLAGQQLADHYLQGEPGKLLESWIEQAGATGDVLRIAVDVELALNDLPWEATTVTAQATPLALHSAVELFRTVGGLVPMPATVTGRPLRIVAAVASPERGTSSVLNYEHELDMLVEAVGAGATTGPAELSIVRWGSVAEIRAALDAWPADILHLTGHATAGYFQLETADGDADMVDGDTFAARVLPDSYRLPLVMLCGCSTASSTSTDVAGFGEQLAGLARRLLERGVPAVLAMTAPVDDLYATRLLSSMYSRMATAGADPLTALSEARCELANEPVTSGPQWWIPTLFAAGDPHPLAEVADAPAQASLAARSGGFIGRRAELRTLRGVLRGDRPYAVLHGLLGSGVSALAAATPLVMQSPPDVVVTATAATGAAGVFNGLADTLRAVGQETRAAAIDQPTIHWRQRLRLVENEVLPATSILLVLDVGEADLASPAGPAWTERALRDGELGGLLRMWTDLGPGAALVIAAPARSR